MQSWLHKGEKFSKKNYESVFYECDKSEKAVIIVKHSSDVDRLKKVLEQYRDPGKNRNMDKDGDWYPGYEISEKGTLVYYSEVGDHVYLSPACLGREVFTKTVGTYAYGSKVRMTDAVLIHPEKSSESAFEKPVILPELGEPKPGTVEFYTEPPYQPSVV